MRDNSTGCWGRTKQKTFRRWIGNALIFWEMRLAWTLHPQPCLTGWKASMKGLQGIACLRQRRRYQLDGGGRDLSRPNHTRSPHLRSNDWQCVYLADGLCPSACQNPRGALAKALRIIFATRSEGWDMEVFGGKSPATAIVGVEASYLRHDSQRTRAAQKDCALPDCARHFIQSPALIDRSRKTQLRAGLQIQPDRQNHHRLSTD